MGKPDVSIVIPTFNAAGFVSAAAMSALGQHERSVEVVVVDDGSTDGTADVLRGLPAGVRACTIPNGGVAAARNHGAALTSGEWLLFLDSDDVLMPWACEQLCAHAGEAGVVYGYVLERGGEGALDRLTGHSFCVGKPPLPAQRNFDRAAIITPGSAVVRRDVFERAGGFLSGTEPMEDRDLWLRCGLLAPTAHCGTVVLDKTWRPGSHGSQAAKRIYRGWMSKARLRRWGAARGLDVSWIPSDADLVTQAIREAIHYRCPEILPALLRDARSAGFQNFWTWRALWTARLIGRDEPEWVVASAGAEALG